MATSKSTTIKKSAFFIKAISKNKKLINNFTNLYNEHSGNWEQIKNKLTPELGFTKKQVDNLQFTHDLSSWNNQDPKLVELFQKDEKTSSMRDIALNYDTKAIKKLLTDKKIELPSDTDATTHARTLHQKLFEAEPSGVLQSMLTKVADSPIRDKAASGQVATFLNNLQDFNIRTTSIYEAIKHPDAFKGIEEEKETVINHLKTIQRIAAVSPVAEAVPILMKANLHTAFGISEISEGQFVKEFSEQFGTEGKTIAKQIHQNAVNSRIQNEQALVSIREVAKGTGIDLIDKSLKAQQKKEQKRDDSTTLEEVVITDGVRQKLKKNNLSWDLLFADADLCECGECTSVYSAAAYFVELLQYLRNNNLDENAGGAYLYIRTDPKNIKGTILEKFFDRKPDLACLELTCSNTNTILPYIDLVNEVMENFIVFPPTKPVFNVADETTGELLAQQQHINYDAYKILQRAVYPFTLPYNQPVDATRIFLEYLETSRAELMNIYRSQREPLLLPETDDEAKELDEMHKGYLQRAYEAEFLGFTEEEYVIVTKEAFRSKLLWDKEMKVVHTPIGYRQKIGLKSNPQYFGYTSLIAMMSTNETSQGGLSFVKKQFLKRTGVTYAELVELLKTQYLNPMMPNGKARGIMEQLNFSYRYLQSLVDNDPSHAPEKFRGVVNFLLEVYKYVWDRHHLDAGKATPKDPCNLRQKEYLDPKEIDQWVNCYFERIGKIIVLEDECQCMSGEFQQPKNTEKISSGGWKLIVRECIIFAVNNKPPEEIRVGEIDCRTGLINITLEGSRFESFNLDGQILVNNNKIIGYIKDRHFIRTDFTETCDISKTRLIHLDGTRLTIKEYDRFNKFIRLWRKLGWTITETDSAIVGLSTANTNGNAEDIVPYTTVGESQCPNPELSKTITANINSNLLSQFVAVKKLMDLTGQELIKLLSFWTDISTFGENSLYSRLFLSHNLNAVDAVFKADKNGAYLSGNEKISDHYPVISAALNLSSQDIMAIMKNEGLTDVLSLPAVSVLYRYRLLAKSLGLKVPALLTVMPIFSHVFQNASATLDFFEKWTAITDAGFDYRQVSYLIQDVDDPLRPFAPDKVAVLKLAKLLYDGINAINEAHKILEPIIQTSDTGTWEVSIKEQATIDLVKAKAVLIYPQPMVDAILGILNGTTIYTTKISIAQDVKIDESLGQKVKFDKQNNIVQITGILTSAEEDIFNSLSNDLAWQGILPHIKKQKNKLFKELLSGVFTNEEASMMSPDVNIKIEADDNGQFPPNLNTAPQKRADFLKIFLPYLRKQLIKRFVIETLSGSTGINPETTEKLILQILTAGTGSKSLYSIFESVQSVSTPITEWNGFIIPSSADMFTFIVKDQKTVPTMILDGNPITFILQEEPENEWWSTQPIPLQKGKLYEFKISAANIDLKNFFWKTATTLPSAIPLQALLPDLARTNSLEAFTKLKKAAIWINGFGFSAAEVEWFFTHKEDFNNFDFNNINIDHFMRLVNYTRFKSSLTVNQLSLLDLFQWASDAPDASLLSKKISALTNWKNDQVNIMLSDKNFNLNDPKDFRNEINLLRLQEALRIADKTSMSTDLLFDWAKPGADFTKNHAIADSIRNTLRGQYLQTDWEQVVKPLNDKLRENQKNALIAYLLVQQPLISQGVNDADGLFEFFLIDVQMDACMETSRIKQAISSVQLYIQRCLLGLEEKNGVPPQLLDRQRWEWMQRYRVWEANRKVFLYPENWIESNLRDDKSPFFKELEGELLQKDISKETVRDALKSYLFKVDEVANMQVVGVYIEGDKGGEKKLHVFSRTKNAPYFFYYRYLDLTEMNWYPWQKMQVDIPSYDATDEDGKIIGNGCYLTPSVWNERLLIFFPQIIKKTISIDLGQSFADSSKTSPKANKPVEYWEIKMGWSELRNGKWTQKQLSDHLIIDMKVDLTELRAAGDNVRNANKKAVEASKWLDDYKKQIDDAKNDLKEATQLYYSNDTERNKITMGAYQSVLDTLTKTDTDPDNETPHETSMRLQDDINEAAQALEDFNNFVREPISDISKFEFVPVLSDGNNPLLGIRVFNNSEEKKEPFEFNGTNLQAPWQTYSGNNSIVVDNFHYNGPVYKSLQINPLVNSFRFRKTNEGYTTYNGPTSFYHPYTSVMLGNINVRDLKSFFAYNLSIPDKQEAYGKYDQIYHELKQPYSIYNWELFFHTPLMLADALSKAQQFEEAMNWYHYVFNPFGEGYDDKRFWRFMPFKEIDSEHILDKIFNQLSPNTYNESISEWRNHPFMPHSVARDRPVAYMKWVVMKYMDNLIAWGDYLFRQDTIESINQATQLYIMASHVLGKRPEFIPKRGKTKPQTYMSMLGKWDAFSNAVTELELAAPFSSQISVPFVVNNNGVQAANIFGFSSALYFCIPNNPKLMAYWDTIADRLFKIRHCENIEGVFRKLPLFEPPIDPALLVKAAAQGLSISSVMNDFNTPMPNYRFYYLLQKALELCGELKSFGNAMLSAVEKKDNETISLIRSRHEGVMNNLSMEIKKQQLEEAQKSLDALIENRKAPELRMKYYLKLIGEDENKIPGLLSDFTEIANAIETPAEESGLKLSKYEKEEMNKASKAHITQMGASIIDALSAQLHAMPEATVAAAPFGVGVQVHIGGTHFGNASNTTAKVMQLLSSQFAYESATAEKKGRFQRAIQERIMQANSAGREIKQIDKQITSQQIRIGIANMEINNQQKQIDNVLEVEEFLKNKYTNEELYVWMKDSLRSLYHQVYSLTYELAKKAEKAYRFERGLTESNFINVGYWDQGRQGLLAGEQLYVNLKQLEAAYQEKSGYDYEITKHISLRQINPLSLLELKELGKCTFDLPEFLFDMDYPGHYSRRIKSISISIPCVAGPYTNVNATLRLIKNKFRNSSVVKDAKDYLEKTDETDERFSSFIIPISAIAASSAQNDGGLFELNFRDERYLPFEGAGVISQWQLELPSFRQFNYDTIADVVMHVRYVSSEGGSRLQASASGSITAMLKSVEGLGKTEGLFALIDLKHDLATEWQKAVQLKTSDSTIAMSLEKISEFLPYYSKLNPDGSIRDLKDILAADVSVIMDTEAKPVLSIGGEDKTSDPEIKIGKNALYHFKAGGSKFQNWTIKLENAKTEIEQCYMVIRFTLK